ncbi:MAG: ABC transporter permease [Ilumatobacter sp.]|nr:ABC transporter permease [Ilumatobacter sp.]
MHGRHPDTPDLDDARTARIEASLRPVRAPWAVVIRSFAFVRKEVVEIVRQPRLLALLVVGPFALLVLFGLAYGDDSLEKKAVFVGAEDSIYAEVLDGYEDQLDEFIESEGLVPTEDEGRRLLDAGDVDVVVVFPADPIESVMGGERAVIRVLHEEIDPIQATAVEIAARLAIQEVNATVLSTVAADAQAELRTAQQYGDRFAELAAQADADPSSAASAATDDLTELSAALDGTAVVLGQLETADPELRAQLDETRAAVTQAAETAEAVGSDDASAEQLADDLSNVGAMVSDTIVLDPDVLVRPFRSETENVGPADVTPTDYFTPSSLALLLQHLALTFAALSLVRDRRTGLFELMRVGPLSSIEIVIGKILAYVLVGVVVAAALIGGAALTLGVSVAGSMGWLVAIVLGVLLSSLSLGMVLAVVSKTESQAVQFAMLALLAGLFFSGFVLPLDTMRYPVKAISWLLPVTYGIDGLQDIMLAGDPPAQATLIGLGALVVVYGIAAIVGLTRQLNREGDS